MQDLIASLQQRAKSAPGSVFCHFQAQGSETTFTWADAWRRSAQFAHLYRARGLGPGDVVAIILKHSPDLYFAFLGAMLARCAPTFMPFPSSKQEPARYWSQHRTLFERIEARAVVTYPENAPAMAEHCPGPQILLAEDAAGLAEDWEPTRVAAGDIAFLQHSSGTTGLKKGVLLSYGAVSAQIRRYAAELRLGEGDVIVSWLPLYHDMGLIACFVLPVMTGTPLVSLDAFEWVTRPRLLFEAIARHRGTHVWLPNFAFHHLCKTIEPEPALDLSSLKAVIDCSEPCRAESLEQFVATFEGWGVGLDQCRVCYAMAETVFAVTQTPEGEPVASLTVDEQALARGRAEPAAGAGQGRRITSVGRPLADVEVRLAGAEGGWLEDGQVGEAAVRAPFLFSGYHKDPERTARRLRDGWYFTGDVGFRLSGELYLLGRTDDLVIINGRNIMAHDVEFAINAEVEEIKAGRCIALGVYSEEAGSQELVVLAELAEGAAAPQKLNRRIKTAVLNSCGMAPREVRIVPPGWLAKSTSGKIARELNLVRYLDMKRAAEAVGAE